MTFVVLGATLFSLHLPYGLFAQAILAPVPSISYQFHNHIHGLGYDSQNQRLFIATHYGLFVWKDGHLYKFGEGRDDFMGFSLHPSNPKIIYTSGHPKSGGNMGVRKSEDGGLTFRRIFSGLLGETVDFHAMAISPANPDTLYGWFQAKLYRTRDSGKSWHLAFADGLPREGLCFGAPCLSADSQKESVVYAGTPNGLFVSHDFGEKWTRVNTNLGAVAGIGVEPAGSNQLFAFTQNLGLAFSPDRGKSWQSRNNGIGLSRQEFIFAFGFDLRNTGHLFAATPEKVFRSVNTGGQWMSM
jgi:hypothetical protein